MTKFLNFISKYRMLDGYISIFGMGLHYKLIAGYSFSTVYIVSLSLRSIFHFDVTYHYRSHHFPAFTSSLSIFNRYLYDTAARGHASVTASLAKYNVRDEEKANRLALELGDKLKTAIEFSHVRNHFKNQLEHLL